MDQNINAIMEEIISPQKLAEKKLKAYKEYCLSILDAAKKAISNMDYGALSSITFYSPAGDCMGSDNYCLNFGFGESKNKYLDIQQALTTMRNLKDVINGDLDPDDFDI